MSCMAHKLLTVLILSFHEESKMRMRIFHFDTYCGLHSGGPCSVWVGVEQWVKMMHQSIMGHALIHPFVYMYHICILLVGVSFKTWTGPRLAQAKPFHIRARVLGQDCLYWRHGIPYRKFKAQLGSIIFLSKRMIYLLESKIEQPNT